MCHGKVAHLTLIGYFLTPDNDISFVLSSSLITFELISLVPLQELLHVFETLDHQSYMLGRYKEAGPSKKSVIPNLKYENSKPTTLPRDKSLEGGNFLYSKEI